MTLEGDFSRKPQENCVLFLWLLQQPATSFIMLPEAGTSSVSRPCLFEGSRRGAFLSPPPSPVSLASWQRHPNACLCHHLFAFLAPCMVSLVSPLEATMGLRAALI